MAKDEIGTAENTLRDTMMACEQYKRKEEQNHADH